MVIAVVVVVVIVHGRCSLKGNGPEEEEGNEERKIEGKHSS
jgi:hypothetical protein